MRVRVDQMISLGGRCRTRYQIDRLTAKHHPGRETGSYFFDWLWRANGFAGTLSALRARLRLDAQDLDVRLVANDHYEVYSRSHQLHFTHDFKFSDASRDADPAQLRREMLAQASAFLEKYAYLADKTCRLLTRAEGLAVVYAHDPISDAQAGAFFDLLASEYCSTPVLIHLPDAARDRAGPAHPRVVSRPISEDAPTWTGCDEAWDDAIGAICATGIVELPGR